MECRAGRVKHAKREFVVYRRVQEGGEDGQKQEAKEEVGQCSRRGTTNKKKKKRKADRVH